jgi:hypothetical protein
MLFSETEFTLPVDFHSWRRAFNQALADAGVNAQQAKGLAGHSSMAAHERYLRNSQKTLTVPVAALPRLTIGHSALGTLNESRQVATANEAEPYYESAPISIGDTQLLASGAEGQWFESTVRAKLRS